MTSGIRGSLGAGTLGDTVPSPYTIIASSHPNQTDAARHPRVSCLRRKGHWQTMLAPLPLSRSLGAGIRLHDAPASAAPRVLCARFRLALRRFQRQTPPAVRRYATIHDPTADDLGDSSQWGMPEQQAMGNMGEFAGDFDPRISQRLERHAQKEEGAELYDFAKYTKGVGEEIQGLKDLLSRKGRRDFPPPGDLVGWLFEAVRAGDPWRAYVFLINATSEAHLTRLVNLPATEFAELLECLDPLRVHDRVDLLANLRCTPANLSLHPKRFLVSKYGVRRIYSSVLDILGPVVEARVLDAQAVTPPAVFTTLLRLAGAASLPRLAYHIRELATQAMNSWSDSRYEASNSGTFMLDYLRTLFLTEPLYYQHDRMRVRTRPRNMPLAFTKLKSGQRKELQFVMAELRLRKLDHFGTDPECPYDDIQRFTGNHLRMKEAMHLEKIVALRPSEDLICAALKVSTASGMSGDARKLLWAFYGIMSRVNPKTGELHFYGGRDGAARPTKKVLMAVVQAFGNSGEVRLALQLLMFMAERYDITVPSEVWSEYIEWAAVHGSRPATVEWEIAGDSRMLRAVNEVPAAIHALEAQDIGYTPSEANLKTLAANLISYYRLNDALDTVRELKAFLEELDAKIERAAVAAAAAEAQGVAMPSYTSGDMALHHLVARREIMRGQLANIARLWIRRAGHSVRMCRPEGEGLPLVEAMVPDFVREFWDVLPHKIEYDTLTGTILIITGIGAPSTIDTKLVRGPDVRLVNALKVLLDPEDDPANYRHLEESEDFEREEGQGVEAEREAEGEEAEREAAEREELERIEAEEAEAERIEAERAEAERVEAERAEAERLAAQSVGETTSFERLIARTIGAQRPVESLVAQNMGGDRTDGQSPSREPTDRRTARKDADYEDADAQPPTGYGRFRALETIARKADAHRAHINAGEGTIWEWTQEVVLARRFDVVHTPRPVKLQLAPRGARAFEVSRFRAVYAQGGRLYLGEAAEWVTRRVRSVSAREFAPAEWEDGGMDEEF